MILRGLLSIGSARGPRRGASLGKSFAGSLSSTAMERTESSSRRSVPTRRSRVEALERGTHKRS